MKNILVNPKVSINKQRKEINDVIDQALIKWLIQNSYNSIVISNHMQITSKKKIFKFFNSLKIKGIVLSGGNDGDKKNPRYASQVLLIDYATKYKIPILGICQGMQMMGVKFGSKLKKDNRRIFVIVGDGESQEGQIWEAIMSAPKFKLNNRRK